MEKRGEKNKKGNLSVKQADNAYMRLPNKRQIDGRT